MAASCRSTAGCVRFCHDKIPGKLDLLFVISISDRILSIGLLYARRFSRRPHHFWGINPQPTSDPNYFNKIIFPIWKLSSALIL